MRRAKFALLVLAVLVNLSFAAACGGGGGTDTVSPSPSVSPSVSPTGSTSPSPSPTGTLPPLAVTGVAPLDAAVNVATFVQVSITFNKAMSTTATQDAFSLEGPDGAIEGMFYWLTGDTVMTFTPLSVLASGATYTVAVSTAATASDGIETLSPAFSSSFQTIAADQVSPTVVSSTPANLAGSIDVSSNIVLEFSEAMTRATVEGAFSLREVGSTSVITGAFSWSTDSKTVTFNPASNMGFAKNMMVALAVEAQSAGGIPLQAPYSSFFTTADDPANPPSVTFVFPTDQMTDLPTNIQVIVRFSQEMNKTATQGAFSLTPEDGVPLEGLFLWVSNTDMTFQPAERLLPGTTCYIVITTDAVSASGVHIATTFNSVFVTGTGSATHTAVPTMGTLEATVLDAPPFGTLWQVTAGAAAAIDDA
ncbi:MAG: Ig-like domain-containing protein, partial [Candidatus Brocadiia bacterium]